MLTVDLKSGLVGVSTMKSLCSSKFDSKGVCLLNKLLHRPRINRLAISCMHDCDVTGVRERESEGVACESLGIFELCTIWPHLDDLCAGKWQHSRGIFTGIIQLMLFSARKVFDSRAQHSGVDCIMGTRSGDSRPQKWPCWSLNYEITM